MGGGGVTGPLWGRFGPPTLFTFAPSPELWASFRGRRLGGRELPLPHGYRGVLLREGDPPHGHEGDPQVRLSHTLGVGCHPPWGRTPRIPPAVGQRPHFVLHNPFYGAVCDPQLVSH